MPPLADILHRTLVVGLLGATVAGVGVGWAVHKDTLRRGEGSSVFSALSHALCVLRSEFGAGENACFEFFIYYQCLWIHHRVLTWANLRFVFRFVEVRPMVL